MPALYNLARMSTATTGTGTVTLGSAVSGFLTFALAGVPDGVAVYYAIQDGANSEIGYGTYTSSGTTLSRDTVLNSTNSGSRISLSGSAEVMVTPAASAFRELLLAARTYHVRTDGSDSNSGLANTSGGAFLTIQKAIDVVASLDTTTQSVTIQCGSGTYSVSGIALRQCLGTANVNIRGDTTTYTNCVIASSGDGFTATNISTTYDIRGFQITSSGSGGAIVATNAYLRYGNIDFGTGLYIHVYAKPGSIVEEVANCSISANFTYHYYAEQSYLECSSRTCTVTANVTCSSQFAAAFTMGHIRASGWSASLGIYSVTGTRYYSNTNSVINTFGGGASYFPGNAGGSTANGGLYF